MITTAVERGYISERVPVPKLTSKGEKGKTRPAFSKEEIDALFVFMEDWQHKGRMSVEIQIRPLLRDYVEMLLLTGMRHGTEAMGIRWKNIEWHTKDGVRYLRIWVDGKTGGRWLIAKHRAVDVQSNVIGTLHLLEIARLNCVRLIVFASSGGTVYGLPRSLPISESHATDPLVSYGIAKLTIEKYIHLSVVSG